MRLFAASIAIAGLATLPSLTSAAEPLSYNRDIRPILANNCFACHGPDPKHREADLRLDVRESAVETEAISPNAPDKGKLIAR